MATLNIKKFPDSLYRKLQARARRERRSVARELEQIVSDALATPKPVSLLDLRGLGREIWPAGNAAKHVRRERDTWD